jgi:hypothetical protein
MAQPTVAASRQEAPRPEEADRRGVAQEPAHEGLTALDLLEDVDRRILRLSADLAEARSAVRRDTSAQRVVDQADYGNRAKLLVRQFATREAAAVDVAEGLRAAAERPGPAGPDAVDEVADRLLGGGEDRRRLMDRVERMSRGVQGMYLNVAQDFDAALTELTELARPQLVWELDVAIPTVRRELGAERCRQVFHSAKHVARHAPTHVAPGGPHWYERAPVVSRLLTVLHHLRDYPRASRDART